VQHDTAEQAVEAGTSGAAGPAAERAPSRRGLALEGLVVYLTLQLLTIPFLPALRDFRQTFYDDTLLGFFGPEKHGLARLLRAGTLPTWLDNQFGGEPFIANLQHGVFYPGNLPFWLLPTATGLEVVVALHLALAGFGMWAYCRLALRTSRWGAALAGLAFGFGAVTLQHIILLNQLQVIAWMPLVLLFGHLALERGGLRHVVLTGVALGVQLLAGHPEEWVYTVVALAAYGLAWTLAAGLGGWPRRALQAAVRLGGAMVLFGLLFAWQLLPTLLLQRYGYRTAPGFNEQYPLPKAVAFNALLPDYGNVLNGENVGFIGVVALALAGLGVWAGPRQLRWVRTWMLLLALLGITMALGNQNELYRLVAGTVDTVRQFRVPARYLLLVYLPMAAAAGLGVDVLLYQEVGRPRRRVLQGLGGLAMVGVVLGTALLLGGYSATQASRQWWLLAATAGAVVWAAAGFRAVPRALLALALLAVTAVELRPARPKAEFRQLVPNVIYNDPGPVLRRLGLERGRYIAMANDRPRNGTERAQIDVPAGYTNLMRDYYLAAWPRRLAALPAWEYATNAETILGRDGGLLPFRAYREFFVAAVNPEGYLEAGTIREAPSRWRWPGVDLLGVRWFVTAGLPPQEQDVLRAHGFRQVQREAYYLLWERRAPPLARMQYQVDVLPDPRERLARLRAGYPLLQRAMVERPVEELSPPPTPPQVELTRRGQTLVEVTVGTATDGLLVLADPWYPQWRVTVDGKPATLLRVDHTLRGVRVPAGTHQVVFTYQDRAMWLGAALTAATCLGLVALWALRRRSTGRAAAQAP
jgi:Bacterial membrane protein YfhO